MLNRLQCHSKQFWQKLQLSWWFNLKRWNSKKRLRETYIMHTAYYYTKRKMILLEHKAYVQKVLFSDL